MDDHMDAKLVTTAYRLIGELFLYPEDRDKDFIASRLERLAGAPKSVTAPIKEFLANPKSQSPDVYLETLEMSPTCPPYLGTYLFEEPTSCRGAGMSGRNNYMLELVNAYGHFGLELNGSELADFIPVVLEFLATSRERSDWDRIGLRRRIVETHVVPTLEPAKARFEKNKSCYGLLIQALQEVVADDAASMSGVTAWQPPAEDVAPPQQFLAAEQANQLV